MKSVRWYERIHAQFTSVIFENNMVRYFFMLNKWFLSFKMSQFGFFFLWIWIWCWHANYDSDKKVNYTYFYNKVFKQQVW